MPRALKRKCRDCVCIIDCSEMFIEMPSNLTARSQTWSKYTNTNASKFTKGISPPGAITFLFAGGWGVAGGGWGGGGGGSLLTSR